MSGGPEGRRLMLILWQTFIKSLKPRPFRGNLMGQDYNGNNYFEIPANPSTGRRKASRWFDPPKQRDFENPLPAEWEAWLRHRRAEPPTKEEIDMNLAIMKMKKDNAARLEAERVANLPAAPQIGPEIRGHDSFPKYKEYDHGDYSKRAEFIPQTPYDKKPGE